MHAIVRSFRSNIIEGRFVSLIVSLGVIIMRALLFFRSEGVAFTYNDTGYLWRYVADFFSDSFVSLIASTISVFLIASLISSINSRFTLIRSRSSLPFAVPLFLLSIHPLFLVMTADYIAVIFILAAFFPLLNSYQRSDSSLFSFRSAILIAVASLFQCYALVLLPLWWSGERSMRGPQFRSFLSSLFGILLVYISLFSAYLMWGDWTSFLQPFTTFVTISLPLLPGFSWLEWSVVVLVVLFFLTNMMLSIKTYARDKVLTLSFMQFMVLLSVFLLLLQLLYWQETLFFLTLSIAFISYLNAYFYSKTQSPTYIYIALLMVIVALFSYLLHFFSVLNFLM